MELGKPKHPLYMPRHTQKSETDALGAEQQCPMNIQIIKVPLQIKASCIWRKCFANGRQIENWIPVSPHVR